jgi:hypothetical protein
MLLASHLIDAEGILAPFHAFDALQTFLIAQGGVG